MNKNSYDKEAWRLRWLKFLQKEMPMLWGSDHKLKYSCIDMVGLDGMDQITTGKSMFNILRSSLHTPKQYVGVLNRADEYVKQFVRLAQEPPENQWQPVYQDAYSLGINMKQSGGYPTAIYSFDDFSEAGHDSWWDTKGRKEDLRKIVKKAFNSNGCCAILINHALGRGSIPDTEKLVKQSEHIAECFQSWGVHPKHLLPDEEVSKLSKKGDFHGEGPVGKFYVYKSFGRSTKMATLKIGFSKEGTKIRS